MSSDEVKHRSTKTAISQTAKDEIRLRGYRIDDLMGGRSFTEVVFLLVVGELPDASSARLLDAILVSSVDHGISPPSTLAARTAASTGAPVNAALAAGILSINEHHGGAIERCMGHLRDVVRLEASEGLDVEAAAEKLVEEARRHGRRLSGFGHRVHRRDPRALRLFALTDAENRSGEWVSRARALEAELVETSGKPLYLNVDGAIAALLLELGIPAELANAVFMAARLPGLIAHVHEEKSRQRPMRRIDPSDCEYDGAPPRELPPKDNPTTEQPQ